MLLALQDIGKAGHVAFVGFDFSSSFLEPLARGEIDGFIAQHPVNMGYLSVKTMVEHLQGQAVPARRHRSHPGHRRQRGGGVGAGRDQPAGGGRLPVSGDLNG